MNLEHALSQIPPHMRDSAEAYVLTGQEPGDFLRAVLENDLVAAGRRADVINASCLHGWACYLDNIPGEASGSREAVDRWISHDGLAGLS